MQNEPFIEAQADTSPCVRLWKSSCLSLGAIVVLVAGFQFFAYPLLKEGFLDHAPAQATIISSKMLEVSPGQPRTTEMVYVAAWTDDQGQPRKGELRAHGVSCVLGQKVTVGYSLRADGTVSKVWPRNPGDSWIVLLALILYFTAVLAIVVLFAQTLVRALRASRPRAPKPGNGLSR